MRIVPIAVAGALAAWVGGCGPTQPEPPTPSPPAPSNVGVKPLLNRIQRMEGQLRAADVRLRERARALRDAEDRLRRTQAQLREWQRTGEASSTALARAREARESGANQVREAVTEIERVTASLIQAQEERDDALRRLAEANARIEGLEREVASPRTQRNARSDDELVARLQAEIAALREQRDLYVPGAEQLFSRRRFAAMVQGRPVAEIVEYLGEPDRVVDGSPRRFVYNRSLTYAVEPSQPDRAVTVLVDERDVAVRSIFE